MAHLNGIKIVLTGDFDTYTTADATKVLEDLGAEVTSSVSDQTDVVFAAQAQTAVAEQAQTAVAEQAQTAVAEQAQKTNEHIPVFGEKEMLRLIAGETLEDLTNPKSEPENEPGNGRTPMPIIPPPPVNGPYRLMFKGTDQVQIEGEFKDGFKEGSWKEYWPNGQLKQDYGWSGGMRHGQELDWTADGIQVCDGAFTNNRRSGTWTFFHHSNGKYRYAYHYNEAGEQHGEFRWLLDDGTLRATGEFFDGKRHGDWEWWGEPNHENMKRGYHRSVLHGLEQATFNGGQLAYERRTVMGLKDGDWVEFYPDGEPKFRGSFSTGVAIGTHHSWDENGEETTVEFKDGVNVEWLTEEKLDAVVKKLKSGRDSNAKERAFRDLPWEEQNPLLNYLWEHNLYDISADPMLWEMFMRNAQVADGKAVARFLKTAVKTKHGDHLPFWGRSIDAWVMKVYATDPEPIEAAFDDYPKHNQIGVAFVRARFGGDPKDVLEKSLLSLAKKHCEEHGLSQKIWWPDGEGGVEHVDLFENRNRAEPTERFRELIGFFGGMERWRDALKPYAMGEVKETVSRLSFNLFYDLIVDADPEELVRYSKSISLNNNTATVIFDTLTKWRADDMETTKKIALSNDDTGLRKWPAICAAISRYHEAGNPIPNDLVDAFILASESPTYSSSWIFEPLRGLPEPLTAHPFAIMANLKLERGASTPRNQMIRDALTAMNETQRRSVFERYLGSDRTYEHLLVVPYLHLLEAPELWERALETARNSTEPVNEGIGYGFAELGLAFVDQLIEIAENETRKKHRKPWDHAIVVALCRGALDGHDIPEKYDPYIRYDLHPVFPSYYQFFLPYIERLVCLLPVERAEKVLLRAFKTKYFPYAFRAIGRHPTETIMTAAMNTLLDEEVSYQPSEPEISFGLKGVLNKVDWVRWVYENGGGVCHQSYSDAIGHQTLAAIEKELADEAEKAEQS